MPYPSALPRDLGHRDETFGPLEHTQTLGPTGGYPAPIIRRKMFAFNPRPLPPVNRIRGGPRVYGA
ncbi:MAG: hypothetical protein KGI98_17570 [Euryarchaeota archaeon]|nr:hypothetical protein [Euryarchaeota archaeon]